MAFYMGSGGALDLLSGETDGLSIDFTSAYPNVQVRRANTTTFSSPHTFFIQQGTSPKTVKTDVATLGWSPHNLMTQSTNLSAFGTAGLSVTNNTNVAPDGTTTGNTLTGDGSSGAHLCFKDNTAIELLGFTWAHSIYLKAGTGTFAYISVGNGGTYVTCLFDLSNGSLGEQKIGGTGFLINQLIDSIGNGWYRCTVAGGNASIGNFMFFGIAGAKTGNTFDGNGNPTSSTVSTILAWGAQSNKGPVATLYMPTTSTTVVGLPISYGEGLLVEPAATNSFFYSEQFDNAAWDHTGVTVTPNNVTAPDGSLTADTLTAVAGATSHGVAEINLTVPFAGNVDHTVSIYAKQGTSRYMLIGASLQTNDWFNAVYDLQTGTVTQTAHDGGGASAVASTSMIAVGNGWWRCILTGHNWNTGTSTTLFFKILDVPTPSFIAYGDYSFTATGTETMFLWGAQCEQGLDTASSYIPTAAVSVTRGTDMVRVPLTSVSPIAQAAPYSMWAGVYKPVVHNSQVGIAFMEDVGFPNDSFGWTIGSFNISFPTYYGHAQQTNVTVAGMSNPGVPFKIAGRAATNNVNAAKNGVLGTADISCSIPTTPILNSIRLGCDTNVTNDIIFFRQFVAVPRAYRDDELQDKST